jgi:hypothetical protein
VASFVEELQLLHYYYYMLFPVSLNNTSKQAATFFKLIFSSTFTVISQFYSMLCNICNYYYCLIAQGKARTLNISVIVINDIHNSINKLLLSFKRKYLNKFYGALNKTFISLNSKEFIGNNLLIVVYSGTLFRSMGTLYSGL